MKFIHSFIENLILHLVAKVGYLENMSTFCKAIGNSTMNRFLLTF